MKKTYKHPHYTNQKTVQKDSEGWMCHIVTVKSLKYKRMAVCIMNNKNLKIRYKEQKSRIQMFTTCAGRQ